MPQQQPNYTPPGIPTFASSAAQFGNAIAATGDAAENARKLATAFYKQGAEVKADARAVATNAVIANALRGGITDGSAFQGIDPNLVDVGAVNKALMEYGTGQTGMAADRASVAERNAATALHIAETGTIPGREKREDEKIKIEQDRLKSEAAKNQALILQAQAGQALDAYRLENETKDRAKTEAVVEGVQGFESFFNADEVAPVIDPVTGETKSRGSLNWNLGKQFDEMLPQLMGEAAQNIETPGGGPPPPAWTPEEIKKKRDSYIADGRAAIEGDPALVYQYGQQFGLTSAQVGELTGVGRSVVRQTGLAEAREDARAKEAEDKREEQKKAIELASQGNASYRIYGGASAGFDDRKSQDILTLPQAEKLAEIQGLSPTNPIVAETWKFFPDSQSFQNAISEIASDKTAFTKKPKFPSDDQAAANLNSIKKAYASHIEKLQAGSTDLQSVGTPAENLKASVQAAYSGAATTETPKAEQTPEQVATEQEAVAETQAETSDTLLKRLENIDVKSLIKDDRDTYRELVKALDTATKPGIGLKEPRIAALGEFVPVTEPIDEPVTPEEYTNYISLAEAFLERVETAKKGAAEVTGAKDALQRALDAKRAAKK